MRILVSGASGFVGRHVINQIQVIGNDILSTAIEDVSDENNCKSVNWIQGDLGHLEPVKPVIKSFNPEVVIHLAWQGIPDYSESISRVNLNNSIQLLDFVIDETNCRKIVISGSCLEYGKKEGVCRESDPIQLTSFFSWAKYSLYRYLLLKCGERKVDLVWFRLFYVYGPGQRRGSLIPTLVQTLKDEVSPLVRSPLNRNDYIYVEDAAEAFQLAVGLKIESGIYNIGSGQARSVYDACKIVEQKILGTDEISERMKHGTAQKREVNFWADMRKTKQALSWAPKTSLEQGIELYINSLD
jgi:nucleoside-diphosphate-sugar epimerase